MTAAVTAFVALVVDPRPWVESLLWALAATGLVCVATLLIVPMRRRRQRRWAELAPRGEAPNWTVLIPRLHRIRRVSWGLLAVAWILTATAARSSAAVTERYESLVERAQRVQGEVVEVHDVAKGLDWMRVTFTYAGRSQAVRIFDIPDRFSEGDEVVVLVDPADIESATVEGVERSTDADRVLQALAVIGALISAGLGLLGARRSSIAGDALLATGVRRSSAWWGRSRHGYRLLPQYGAGSGIEVGMAMVSNRSLEGGGEPVRVAGPERGPIVLLDRSGLVGTVRRPLLPKRDLRRVVG